jgi:predicted CoA-binding protein
LRKIFKKAGRWSTCFRFPFFLGTNFDKSILMKKKTLVLGASPKPERYSYKAINMLLEHHHPVVAVGAREAQIGSLTIQSGHPHFDDLHTLTLYLGPERQKNVYDYILNLKPKRIIFNPGTENPELYQLARDKGIEVEEACTLVLLSTNQF